MELVYFKNKMEEAKILFQKQYDQQKNEYQLNQNLGQIIKISEQDSFNLCQYELEPYLNKIYSKSELPIVLEQLKMASFLKENMNRFSGYQFSQINKADEQLKQIVINLTNYYKKNYQDEATHQYFLNQIQTIDQLLTHFKNQELIKPFLHLQPLETVFGYCQFDYETKSQILLEIIKANASLFVPNEKAITEDDLFYDKELSAEVSPLSLEEQILLSKIQKILNENQSRLEQINNQVKKYISILISFAKEENNWDFLEKTTATVYFQDTVLLELLNHQLDELKLILNKEQTDKVISEKNEVIDDLKILYEKLYHNLNTQEKQKIPTDLGELAIYYLQTTSDRNYLLQDIKKIDLQYHIEIDKALTEIKQGIIQNDQKLEIYNKKLKDVFEKNTYHTSIDYLILSPKALMIIGCHQKGDKSDFKALSNRLENYNNKKKIEEASQNISQFNPSEKWLLLQKQLHEQWLKYVEEINKREEV